MKKTNILTRFIFAYILMYCSYESHADLRVAISNGHWKNTGTWQGGNLPGPGDSIVIPNGRRVVVTEQEDYTYSSQPMQLNILGELNFQTGKKLNLPTGSYIVLHVGAFITPGVGAGNSSWIYVGTTMVWHAAHGTITGYMILPYVPLPVEMNTFNATLDNYNQQVKLYWETFAEVDNSHFDVERSSDGWKFTSLGKVPGSGTSSVGAKYVFVDDSPLIVANYYRLKQVDYIGSCRYTRIIYLLNDDRYSGDIKISPNPSVGELYLRMQTEPGEENITLTTYNNSGRRIIKNKIPINEGFSDLTLDEIISELPKGVYSVHLSSTIKNHSEKLIIQ